MRLYQEFDKFYKAGDTLLASACMSYAIDRSKHRRALLVESGFPDPNTPKRLTRFQRDALDLRKCLLLEENINTEGKIALLEEGSEAINASRWRFAANVSEQARIQGVLDDDGPPRGLEFLESV